MTDETISYFEDKKDSEELTLPSTIYNNITHTPTFWGQFKQLKKLELNNNDLTTLPSCLGVLSSLEILFLSENKFETIPECIGKLPNLRMLSLRGNNMIELSSTNLPTKSLVWLILTNNNIRTINSNVGELRLVRKLMLSHNNISTVPKELGLCKDLELVRLANNEISTPLPIEVLSLPKLAWISLGGNPVAPCGQRRDKIIPKTSVSYDQEKILGRGASGTVYLGKHNKKDVAVKIFKAHSTGSDGAAEDEAAINSLVDHQLAVTAHGIFLSEDDKTEGMIMELLPDAEAVGKVPNFKSVTRDAEPSDSAKNMSKDEVLSVVYNVAVVLEHTHSSNVVNGDVYLHNILQCGESGAKVSDWGASFVYDRDKYPIFERIEVLAFGRLVQDLFLWHLDTSIADTTEPVVGFCCRRGTKTLEPGLFSDLMSLILQPNQLGRPSFRDIKDTLSFLPEFNEAASRFK